MTGEAGYRSEQGPMNIAALAPALVALAVIVFLGAHIL
jgi:hypothetical protein